MATVSVSIMRSQALRARSNLFEQVFRTLIRLETTAIQPPRAGHPLAPRRRIFCRHCQSMRLRPGPLWVRHARCASVRI